MNNLGLNINGQQLEVRQINGPPTLAPIVFLHEGLGSVSMWTQRGLDWPLAVCQATGRAGVVYSRRGYGQSDAAPPGRNILPPDYMHREAFDVLPALLAELHNEKPRPKGRGIGYQRNHTAHCRSPWRGTPQAAGNIPAMIQNPVLLGHSDGATIALLHASRLPVAACIAMAPHVLVESVAVNAIAQARLAFETGDLRQRLAKHHADVDGAFWQWNDVWLSKAFASFDIRAECQRITAPLLLVQGLSDEYGTMLQLDEIALAAPHAQQIRLANCGHSPQRDQPQLCVEGIVDFLKSVN